MSDTKLNCEWLNNISISTIPSEHMQMIAEKCGIEDAISLMLNLPGLEIYVPAAGKKRLNHKFIKSTYNGANAASIAVKLGIDREKVKRLAALDYNPEILTNYYVRLISSECGTEVAIRLMQHFPRYKFYVPKDGFSIVRRKFIEQNFSGSNVPDLARLCQVSERHIRAVISNMYASTAQTSLQLF